MAPVSPAVRSVLASARVTRCGAVDRRGTQADPPAGVSRGRHRCRLRHCPGSRSVRRDRECCSLGDEIKKLVELSLQPVGATERPQVELVTHDGTLWSFGSRCGARAAAGAVDLTGSAAATRAQRCLRQVPMGQPSCLATAAAASNRAKPRPKTIQSVSPIGPPARASWLNPSALGNGR